VGHVMRLVRSRYRGRYALVPKGGRTLFSHSCSSNTEIKNFANGASEHAREEFFPAANINCSHAPLLVCGGSEGDETGEPGLTVHALDAIAHRIYVGIGRAH